MPKYPRVCPICNRKFEAKRSDGVCCGQKCSDKHSYHKKKESMKNINHQAARLPRLDNQPILNISDALLFSDPHCPAHNPKMFEWMLEVIKKENIRIGVCIGDLFDFNEMSKYLTIDKGISARESVEAGVQVALSVVEFLDELHILLGNHDVRLARRLDQSRVDDPFGFMAEIIERFINCPRVKYHLHTNMTIKNKVGSWKLCHPSSYSRIAPQVERRLAEKFHANIIGTHGHLVGIGFDSSSKYLVAQIGHMADERKLEYKQEKITTHPEWQNAFATLKEGKLKMYIDHPAWRN